MNLLIVNQSVIDMSASFLTLLTYVVEMDVITRMSRNSIYDQFVCRAWLTRVPLWALLNTSTYGILITAFERYFAVIYPMWYNVSVPFYYHRSFTIWPSYVDNLLRAQVNSASYRQRDGKWVMDMKQRQCGWSGWWYVYWLHRTSYTLFTTRWSQHEANLEHTSCTCISNCFIFASSCKQGIIVR